MCVDEINSAIEFQKELGADTSKGAIALMKVVAKVLDRVNQKIDRQAKFCTDKWQEVQSSNEELRSEMVQFKAESMADRQSLREDIAELKSEVLKSLEKASKWKALTDMLTACFGTIQDTIKTLLIIGFFVGAVHFKDIIDLVKMIL